MGLEARANLPVYYNNTARVFVYRSQPWYDSYMAALFESDRACIEERIRTAERLILARERELYSGSEREEQHALNTALHALRALHMCLKTNS